MSLQLQTEKPSMWSISEEQLNKASAVTAGVTFFSAFQMRKTFLFGFKVGLVGAAITLLAEKCIRYLPCRQNDWFDYTHIDKALFTIIATVNLVAKPLLLIGTACLLGPLAPAQTVASYIMAGNLKMILSATLIAPICEEIIFRGFIQERIEDFFYLVSNLSQEWVKKIACFAQAVIFGAAHIVGSAVKGDWAAKLVVFLGTGTFGFFAGWLKNLDQTLLSPAFKHFSNNTGVSMGLLGSVAVR